MTITDEAVREMTRNLNDFGYRIDFEHCRKAIDALMAGEAPKGGPQMFMQTWLRDANLLPIK